MTAQIIAFPAARIVRKAALIVTGMTKPQIVADVPVREKDKSKFEVGSTYYARSMCDHDSITEFTVVKRTAKRVTLRKGSEEVVRGVYAYEGIEQCKPYGNYSMAMILSADKVR